MVWRSRVIRTRSSRAASSAGDGARTCTAAAGCGTGIGVMAARSMAASMSPLVTRPSLPVPATAAGSIAGFAGDAAHRRRQRRVGSSRFGRRRRGDGRQRRLAAVATAGAAFGSWRLCGRSRRRRGAAARRDGAEQCADRDGVAVLGGDFRQHAGGRRRHFDRHLVGFEFDQRLVDGDRVAWLLEPLADGRFGHGLAQRGYLDFGHEVWS